MHWINPVLQRHAKGTVEPTGEHSQRLTSGVYRLNRRDQILRVLSGYAWVSMDGQDIILTTGQELHITPGKTPILLEALRKQPLHFVVCA